jgi:hypothetical protein
LNTAIISTRRRAAILVRNATTANGENFPIPIAALPKTGARPRKKEEITAALIPVFRPIRINDYLLISNITTGNSKPVVVKKMLHCCG